MSTQPSRLPGPAANMDEEASRPESPAEAPAVVGQRPCPHRAMSKRSGGGFQPSCLGGLHAAVEDWNCRYVLHACAHVYVHV